MSTERMVCGCIMSTSPLGVLTIMPCSREHARYAMQSAAEHSTPMETRVNPGCWSCGSPNDDFTGIGATDLPDEDSVSICAYCGALSMFTGQALLTRKPTTDELAELMGDETIRKAVAAVHMRNATIA